MRRASRRSRSRTPTPMPSSGSSEPANPCGCASGRPSRDLPAERSANVIGEIPGTRSREEIVLLGAHLDSWDPGVGALDNARGRRDHDERRASSSKDAGHSSPAARSASCCSPTRSSARPARMAYLAAHEAELPNHVLGFEADFGAGPVWRLSSRVNPAQLPAVDQIHRALGSAQARTRRQRGHAAAPISTASPSSACRCSSPDLDGIDYFDVHHTANDTLAMVDPEGPAAVRRGLRRQRLARRAVSRRMGTRDDRKGAAALTPGGRMTAAELITQARSHGTSRRRLVPRGASLHRDHHHRARPAFGAHVHLLPARVAAEEPLARGRLRRDLALHRRLAAGAVDLFAGDEGRHHVACSARPRTRDEPTGVARAGDWQAARSLGPWSLLACDVGPGFDFEDFAFIASIDGHAAHFRGPLANYADLL